MEEKKLNEILKGVYDSLTDEQKEKAKACKTMEELIALAGQESIELPDEIMDAVAGGHIIADTTAKEGYSPEAYSSMPASC